VRSGLSSQLHPYIVNKTWFLSCDRILKQPIYVAGFSTSQNRIAPALQRHGESALDLLAVARKARGLGIITKVIDTTDLTAVAKVLDIIQAGARNIHKFSLLKKVGAQDKPVLPR
jgi:3-deoxy-D-arabino-heptulosonate 7-phosphate (DAHP) synthase